MRYFLLASIALHAALFANWPAQDLPGHTGGPITLSVLIDNDVAPQEKSYPEQKRKIQTRDVQVAVTSAHTPSRAQATASLVSSLKPKINLPAKTADENTAAHARKEKPDDAPQAVQTASYTEAGSQILANLRHAFLPYFTYPKLARIKGWQGTVELTVNIDAQGQLTAARIVHSSGYGILDHAALNSIRRVKMLPNAGQWLDNHGLEVNFPVIYQLVDS